MSEISNKNKVIVLLNYFLGYLVIYPIIIGFVINTAYKYLGLDISFIVQFAFYIIFLISMGILCKPALKDLIKGINTNFTKILKITVGNLLIGYALSYVINMIIMIFTNQYSSVNQVSIETQLASTPLLIVFVTVIFAPIVEELVFRGVIYKFIEEHSNFIWAAILSAFVFGGLHVVTSIFTLNFADLLFSLTYIAQGIMIAKNYFETKSFAGAWLYHFLNNFIAIIILLLLG
jgi:uncharacterized protein